jgi:tetratricopeptide (TPR) repeat protein
MFEFGRELKRLFGATDHDSIAWGDADVSLMQMMDTAELAAQARAADVEAGRVSTKDPFPHQLEASVIWREHARRSGDRKALRKAVAASAAAAKAADTEPRMTLAALEQALVSLTGAEILDDPRLLERAERQVSRAALSSDPVVGARVQAAHARLAAHEALAADNDGRALEAAALFDAAVHELERLASPLARLESAAAHLERAELCAWFGERRGDARQLEAAAHAAAGLLEWLDEGFEPLVWSRAAGVLGTALTTLGAAQMRQDLIAQGVASLARAAEGLSIDSSPLDWARAQLALGVGLQLLGEACDNEAAFAEAAKAFDKAGELTVRPPLRLRVEIVHRQAALLAQRAERRGDLASLGKAESALRHDLYLMSGGDDPACWAVMQLNLARVYEARADWVGRFRDREGAVYALEESIEVFCEHGFAGLAEEASERLARIAGSAD